MDIVKFKNYSWKYSETDKYVLKNINLTIQQGEFLGIIGNVGSGRSTLCMSLLGLVPHLFYGKTKGELIVDDIVVKKAKISDLSSRVGLVLQSPDTQLTGAGTNVEEELAFGLENLGVPRREIIKKVDSMLKLLNLEQLRNRSPFELSGGQQQKVAIASVFIMEPKILVLDEPTAQLDPLGTEQVFSFIKKLAKKGTTIILNTQKIDYIAEFADRIAVVNKGRVVKVGETREILTNVELLRRNGISPTVFTKLSEELIKNRLYKGELAMTFGDAVKIMKKVKRK
ncbi:MAG: ABC transporter ATP-binding protein [Candidatus Nanoarchaeia archaeon]|nr:ABC transporter ATP-binding protein [Candidatus Nanoarchaeia archaeon]